MKTNKTTKAKAKTTPKIKVKNKFFADINIQLNKTVEVDESGEQNIIQEDISNSQSRKNGKNVNTDIVIDKPK